MIMKQSPVKPVQVPIKKRINIDGGTLAQLNESVGSADKAEVYIVSDGGYENQDWYLEYWVPESDEEFKVRMLKYEIKLEEYNKWYEENKALIESTKSEKEKRAVLKAKKQIVSLEKQLAALKKTPGVAASDEKKVEV